MNNLELNKIMRKIAQNKKRNEDAHLAIKKNNEIKEKEFLINLKSDLDKNKINLKEIMKY